jgi:hypothetical protein
MIVSYSICLLINARVTLFIRGEEGKKLQSKLWDETLGVLREQIGNAERDELLKNLKQVV